MITGDKIRAAMQAMVGEATGGLPGGVHAKVRCRVADSRCQVRVSLSACRGAEEFAAQTFESEGDECGYRLGVYADLADKVAAWANGAALAWCEFPERFEPVPV